MSGLSVSEQLGTLALLFLLAALVLMVWAAAKERRRRHEWAESMIRDGFKQGDPNEWDGWVK